ncbi:MAG: pyrroline-5-carboxylate reductase [Desulfobacterales bacterium]|nr:pyrroline-5-carboxylate reductase [Desulfobacterales bacterium]
MQLDTKIGFIGGGKMGEALVKGIVDAGLAGADRVVVAEPDQSRRKLLTATHGIAVHRDSGPVWSQCGIVLLAVKPQMMREVLLNCRDQVNDSHLIISIAAGITLDFLEGLLGDRGCRLVRVMPNTPALVLEAASALSLGPRATAADQDTAVAIFNAIGSTVVVAENQMDAITGLSGSGPAYVFSFIEALTDAGVREGLGRDVAEKLVLQTILGSVKLALTSKEHPAQLRAMVTSPGGTTIAGLHVLATAGFNGIIMNAVAEATQRSRELGES